MRLLLARGANPKASPNEEAELLRIAHDDHPETRQIVVDAGIQLKDLAQSGAPSLTNYPLSNTGVIRDLLDLGADSNPRGRFPVVALAAFSQRRRRLDAGAALYPARQERAHRSHARQRPEP